MRGSSKHYLSQVFLRIERSFGRWKHKFRISFNVEHSKIIEDFCYRPLISYLKKWQIRIAATLSLNQSNRCFSEKGRLRNMRPNIILSHSVMK